MNELSLFAGAGGGILAAKLLGWRTVCAHPPTIGGRFVGRMNIDGWPTPMPLKKYMVKDLRIERVEVASEKGSYVFLLNGKRHPRHSYHSNYFETFAEAKAYVIRTREVDIMMRTKALERLRAKSEEDYFIS